MKTKSTLLMPALVALAIAASLWIERQSRDTLLAPKTSQAEAERLALAKVPGGRIESAELERADGTLIWSVDVAVPNSRNVAEVQVDAKTGGIVATKIETPRGRANESNAEQDEVTGRVAR